jgi:hypothetical protein
MWQGKCTTLPPYAEAKASSADHPPVQLISGHPPLPLPLGPCKVRALPPMQLWCSISSLLICVVIRDSQVCVIHSHQSQLTVHHSDSCFSGRCSVDIELRKIFLWQIPQAETTNLRWLSWYQYWSVFKPTGTSLTLMVAILLIFIYLFSWPQASSMSDSHTLLMLQRENHTYSISIAGIFTLGPTFVHRSITKKII